MWKKMSIPSAFVYCDRSLTGVDEETSQASTKKKSLTNYSKYVSFLLFSDLMLTYVNY